MKNDQVATGVNEDSTTGKLRFRPKHTKLPKPARTRLELNPWPHDCLRHSAASYWLQLEGDAAHVALWLGHTQEVLHEHYKGLLSDPAHAAQWFAIVPDQERTSAKIISIKAA